MATGFAYVPSTGDGLTLVKKPDVGGDLHEIDCPAGCGERVYNRPDLLVRHIKKDHIDPLELLDESEPFFDDPFARDSCA